MAYQLKKWRIDGVFIMKKIHCIFYRSWTGYRIFECKIHKENERYFINEFLVERNPEKYRITDDAYDIEAYNNLVVRLFKR